MLSPWILPAQRQSTPAPELLESSHCFPALLEGFQEVLEWPVLGLQEGSVPVPQDCGSPLGRSLSEPPWGLAGNIATSHGKDDCGRVMIAEKRRPERWGRGRGTRWGAEAAPLCPWPWRAKGRDVAGS